MRTPESPGTAGPTIATGRCSFPRAGPLGRRERKAHHQQGIDPLAQQPRIEFTTVGLAADFVEQDVVPMIDEHMLRAIHDRREEPSPA